MTMSELAVVYLVTSNGFEPRHVLFERQGRPLETPSRVL
jgi:hypothetical protein